MTTEYRLRNLTIFTLCLTLFWGAFGLDLVLNPTATRFPLHRFFIFLTALIFVFNISRSLPVMTKNKTLVALIFYVLLTAAWANSPSDVTKDFVFLLSGAMIATLAALIFESNKLLLLRWLFWLFFLMTLASIFVAIQYPLLGINTISFGKPRWIGITAHPNGLGAQSSILIWLSSSLYVLSKSKGEKFIIVIAILAAMFTIVEADSMTSLLSSFAVIGMYYYYYAFRRISSGAKVIMLFIAFFGAAFAVAFMLGEDTLIDTAFRATGRTTNFSGRTLLWETALTAVANNPIIGYGFDNLVQLSKIYRIEMSHLHNGYVEILTKGGMIAIIMLFFVLKNTFITLLRLKSTHRQEYIFLNSGFVMILLHNITESSILRGLDSLGVFLSFIIISTSLLQSQNNPRKLFTMGRQRLSNAHQSLK